ncbi:hypothetical protein BDZ97DRAFT_1671707 [Flammula alnicola]|nr:hypothetical protein BDZ97DRAFT_1671707 [Flammula alnicola]
MRETADRVAKAIWECLKYRFHYHRTYKHQAPSARFYYHCAQAEKHQNKSKKGVREGAKPRDKGSMGTFPCKGWLKITVYEGSPSVEIKLNHAEEHIPYWCINVPPNIREFVEKNRQLTSTQLWQEVLKIDPKPAYSQKAIYQLWSDHTSKQWKRDPDEVKSAKILIDEASKNGNSLYNVEPIPLHNEEGFTAIAFALPEILHQWGGRIREQALDSTWNTNGSRFEVYALLGEVYGSGCPLGYLLIRSSGGESGGKERFIADLLEYFNKKWKLRLQYTDEENVTQINSVSSSIKTRLSILRRRPKYYDVKEAKKKFNWIDEKFVPIAQAKEPNAGVSFTNYFL